MTEKTKKLQLVLNELEEIDDPTAVKASFVIMDFEESGNGAIVEKDVATGDFAKSILNKPIVGAYNKNDGVGTDHFESHNVVEAEDRYGNPTVEMETTPMGVFTTEGYVSEIDVEGGTKEVLMADAILWRDRFQDAIDLLFDWHTNGIVINTSCEFLYSNYEVEDGVEYIKEPIYFSAHAILNSSEVDGYGIVAPAYETSRLVSLNEMRKFNDLVQQAVNDKKEDDKMPELYKKVFELSHSDIRTKLYKSLDGQLEDNQYSWIRDVYESHFIVEIDTVTENDYSTKTVKMDYTKDGDNVTVNTDSEKEVMKKTEWVELEETQELQAQLSSKKEELNALKKEVKSISEEKSDAEEKFNKASEKLTSLNEEVEKLKEYKKKYNQEKFERQLNEKKEYYSTKFSALGAADKFDSDEVQELVEQSVEDSGAELKLNSMLVDLVVVEEKEEKKDFYQLNNKRKDLIETETDFDSRYK